MSPTKEVKEPIIVDLDDFCEGNTSAHLLFKLRLAIPDFKVTLFTIPGKCSLKFIKEWKDIPWVDMVPHGHFHPTSRECETWDFPKCDAYLRWLEHLEMTKGFKAPGWQISDAMYEALLLRGYFVADQTYNNDRRPVGLKTYLLDSDRKIHGHIGHLGGRNANELSLIYDEIMAHSGEEFGFVKDALQ